MVNQSLKNFGNITEQGYMSIIFDITLIILFINRCDVCTLQCGRICTGKDGLLKYISKRNTNRIGSKSQNMIANTVPSGPTDLLMSSCDSIL